jgi:hypothetical protein
VEGQEEEGHLACSNKSPYSHVTFLPLDLTSLTPHSHLPIISLYVLGIVCCVLQGGAEGSAWGRASKRAVATHAASPPKHKQPPPQSQVG